MDNFETITVDFEVLLDQVGGKYRVLGCDGGNNCNYDRYNKFEHFTGKIFSPTKTLTIRNGFLHSFNDQPAFESSFSLYWFNDGIVHRKGGPAKIINGENQFYSWGHKINFNEYLKSMHFTNEEKLDLVLKYG